MEAGLVVIAVIVAFLLIVAFAAIKVVQEYERGVVFRLGRLMGPRGPGLILLLPFIERMMRVDLRTVTMDIPAQEVITRDNVTVRVNAVAYFRVVDPNAAVVNVADYIRATSQIAQTTLRSILGQSQLDELLSEREQINLQLQKIIDEQTEPWGIKVSVVEVKDVELPQSMQRAMARQAEAEREKRAKIIHAEGEFQASQQLANAADVIHRNPVSIQLRYLQTLTEIGVEKNTTVVFPLPIELLSALIGRSSMIPTSADDEPSAAPTPTPTAFGESGEQVDDEFSEPPASVP
jgi:regulator of protease activity HflC (stomatin/prohibitin superfamily)